MSSWSLFAFLLPQPPGPTIHITTNGIPTAKNAVRFDGVNLCHKLWIFLILDEPDLAVFFYP